MLQSLERSAPLTYNAAGLVATDSLVRQYTPLVKRIAHHMIARLPASVQIDDLVQAGMMGLLDASSRFDEAQGIQFETFAAQRIRGAMLDELRESDWLPRSARKAQRDIDQATQKVQQRERRVHQGTGQAGRVPEPQRHPDDGGLPPRGRPHA